MKKIITLLLFFITAETISQNELGSWNIININMKINQKINVFTESQLRSLAFYNDFHYFYNDFNLFYNDVDLFYNDCVFFTIILIVAFRDFQ